MYKELFNNFEDIKILDEPNDSISNFWLNTLRFNFYDIKKVKIIRNNLLEQSHKLGLMLRPT